MNERINKLFKQVKVNEQIERLADQAGCTIDRLGYGEGNLEKFAKLIIYDFLSELTNDDDLGEARVATIQRLSDKWGVER